MGLSVIISLHVILVHTIFVVTSLYFISLFAHDAYYEHTVPHLLSQWINRLKTKKTPWVGNVFYTGNSTIAMRYG